MKYGTKSEITIIDSDSGSYREKIEHYKSGEVFKTKVTYCIRKRVENKQQELAEFIKFRKEYDVHKAISFGVEKPRDFDGTWWYVTKTFKD